VCAAATELAAVVAACDHEGASMCCDVGMRRQGRPMSAAGLAAALTLSIAAAAGWLPTPPQTKTLCGCWLWRAAGRLQQRCPRRTAPPACCLWCRSLRRWVAGAAAVAPRWRPQHVCARAATALHLRPLTACNTGVHRLPAPAGQVVARALQRGSADGAPV
jgi:hypothetical protein